MYIKREGTRRILSLFITLLFMGSMLAIMAPAMAEAPAEGPAPAAEPTDAGSRAPESCTSRTTGWSITGTHTYTGTCTISGGAITINSGADITFEALTLTHSGSYYMYVYGSLRILNSTVKGASTSWYGILGSSNPLLKIENSNVQTYMYYGARAYYTTDVQIGNSTFDGANVGNYGIYVYMSTKGWIDNNTIKRVDTYGFYIYQSSNIKFTYNNINSCTATYAVYSYYFGGVFDNNTITCGNTYSMYISYNSPSSFAHNTVTNGRGIYIYGTEVTAHNCRITGNTGQDVRTASSPGKLRAYDTILGDKLTVDSGTSIEVYWRANISAKWLSDNSPVQDGEVTITDTFGTEDDRDPLTDANGEVRGIYLMEFSKESSGKKDMSPYWINITKDLDGKTIFNSTQLTITEDANNADMMLDDVPPWLTITAPEDGVITNQSTVTVTGKTEKNVSAEWPIIVKMILGGKLYQPVVNELGTFEQEIALNSDGTHEISIGSYDHVMNEIKTSVSVIKDTVKPALTIDEPADETLTNIPTITVAGTTEVGATLYVNDVEITVDQDGHYTTDVSLAEGDNIIDVKCRDSAMNWNYASVMVELDTREPVLIIAEPLDGLKTNEVSQRILGTTEQRATVKVNGNNVILAGTSFQTQLNLQEGDNSIEVMSCDLAGNCNTTTVSVFLDTIVPELTVTSPADEYLTNVEAVTITGTVEAGAEVTINGRDADIFGTDWTYECNLRLGKNSIKVEAKDEVGNKAMVTITVYLDTKPPDLLILEPENGATVNTPKVTLTGNTEADASVKVAGEPVGVISASFTTQVSLVEGKNDIKVEATDIAGNVASVVIQVTLDTKVTLEVANLDASIPKETTDDTINITGKADPDAKVYVNGYYVQSDKNGNFGKEVELVLGGNEISVEAVDTLGNKVTKTYTVTKKNPPSPPPVNPITIGGDGDGPMGGLMLPILLIVIILVVIIAVAVAVSRKKKAARLRAQEEKAAAAEAEAAQAQQQQQMQAANVQPTGPPAYMPGQATYVPQPAQTNGYGNGNGASAYGTGPTTYAAAPDPYATATYGTATALPPPPPPAEEPSYSVTPEAMQYYEMAERFITESEAAGQDMTKPRRHFKIAQMFLQKGNSEKVVHYSKKAMENN